MLPEYELKTRRNKNGTLEVHDPIRQKYVAATPEELVRQRLTIWLAAERQVPPALVAVEKKLTYNKLAKRFDLLVYSRQGTPLLLAECKAPDVPLTNETLLQAAIYNSHFDAQWLLVTNGKALHSYRKSREGQFLEVLNLPAYEALHTQVAV